MGSGQPAGTSNTVSGGIQLGPVVQGREVQASFHLPAAAPVALAQLPGTVAGFTGRDGELGLLAGLLDPAGSAGAVVVSAVAGLAGVGKTTLAVHAGHAARAQGWFGGGVLFIDLHGYDDQRVEPAQALDGLLRALGVPAEHIPPGTEQRAGLYRSVLAQIGEPVLVIADNACSEAQVRSLLPGTGPHKVLVTSRHTLAGLGARLVDVTTLNEEESIALLDAALQAARPGYERIAADLEAARRLAGACGGLPLALAITAAILVADPSLTVQELAGELGDERRRLERLVYDDGTEAADCPGDGRPGSVAAAFGLSVRRLDDASARLFRLLAIAPGPNAAVAGVAALAGLDAPEARLLLAGLGRAHLAEPVSSAPGRWRMHDLVRLYARERSDTFAGVDGRQEALGRLFAWYLEMAGAADSHLRALPGMAVPQRFAGREDALVWLDAERPALTAAITLAAAVGEDQVAMLLPLFLSPYLGWRRRFDDLVTALGTSLSAARRLGDRRREAAALTSLGVAQAEMRQIDDAITAFTAAADSLREVGDRHGEGMALDNLGVALAEVRRFDEAITAHTRASDIFRETGDRHGEGQALNNLGSALAEARRLDEAITAHTSAVDIYRQTGNRHGEGKALYNLGVTLQTARRLNDAITAHTRATDIYQETGDRHGEGTALNNLGDALHDVGRFNEAITAHRDAAAIYRQTGDRHGEGNALGNLGVALREVGRFEEAITACQDAAAIFRETGDRHRESMALDNVEAARAAQQA